MNGRVKLLVFVRHYLPGFQSGGPVRTIANLVASLGDEFDISIVTLDRDALDVNPYPNIQIDRWQPVGRARVRYLGARQLGMFALAAVLRETEYDLLYLNSYFDVHFSLKPLLLRYLGLVPRKPCVIAPRGEFSPGALALKGAKKRVYIFVSRLLGLHRGLTWQASSQFEQREIKEALGNQAGLIRVAPNLPTTNSTKNIGHAGERAAGEAHRICFVSRISPKKHLDFALEVLMRVKARVEFDIYGPVRDQAYWSHCQALIQAMPEHISVSYRGSLQPEEVASVLARHDLFFLPTLGENYGHAIAEALWSGTPVLISDRSPWRNLEGEGVGWDLDLASQEPFVRCIEQCAALQREQYVAWRERIRAFAAQRLHKAEDVEANRRLFIEAATSGASDIPH